MRHNIPLLFSAMIATAVTACSSDDSAISPIPSGKPDAQQQEIRFSSSVTSRSGTSITSLASFQSIGTLAASPYDVYLPQTEFAWDAAESAYKSATKYYWPLNVNLNLYASSNFGSSQQLPSAASPLLTCSYMRWAGTEDLVAAVAIDQSKQDKVPLAFHHLCSQIAVSAEAGDAEKGEALTFRVKSIRLKAAANGQYNFATATGGQGEWLPDTRKEWGRYDYDEALPGNGADFPSTGSLSLDDCAWNILPVAQDQIFFDLEYQVLQNGQVIADFTGQHRKVCEVSNPVFEPGKRYVFNFKLDKADGSTPAKQYPYIDDPDDGEPEPPVVGGGGATEIKYTMTMGAWVSAPTQSATVSGTNN